MMDWKLEYKGKCLALADWDITRLKRTRCNMGVDFVELGQGMLDIGIGPSFEAEEVIKIWRGDVLYFQGIVTQTPQHGNANSPSNGYQVSGPWWYLENLVYQQRWRQVKDTGNVQGGIHEVDSGRIILGQDTDGKAIASGRQIRDVLEYVIAQGAPMQIGSVPEGCILPSDECKDLSCAEVVHRLLSWTPDAVVWFDYTQSPPALHLARRSGLKRRTHGIDAETSSQLSIQARKDLQVPSVVLKYESAHSVDGESWTTTSIDAYPQNANGREFKSLVLTIPLDGEHSSCIEQDVDVEPVQIHNVRWWQEHLPALRGIETSKITIHDAARSSGLPNELIHGSVAGWMDVKVEEDRIAAKISYESDTESVHEKEVALIIYSTDAKSDTYRRELSWRESEPVPEGLAKAIYEAAQPLHYEGSLLIQNEECEAADWMGCMLNIEGGQEDWAKMDAIVQSLVDDVTTGQTRVRFGPPRHLGPYDLVQLLRANRNRTPASSSGTRRTGRSNKGLVIQQGRHSRFSSGDLAPGAVTKMLIKHKKSDKRAILMDASKLQRDGVVEPQEEYVCENGVLKKRYVLASKPFSEQSQ